MRADSLVAVKTTWLFDSGTKYGFVLRGATIDRLDQHWIFCITKGEKAQQE